MSKFDCVCFYNKVDERLVSWSEMTKARDEYFKNTNSWLSMNEFCNFSCDEFGGSFEPVKKLSDMVIFKPDGRAFRRDELDTNIYPEIVPTDYRPATLDDLVTVQDEPQTQPNGGNDPCFCVYDSETCSIFSLESIYNAYKECVDLFEPGTTLSDYLELLFKPCYGYRSYLVPLDDVAVDSCGRTCLWSELDPNIDDLKEYRKATEKDIIMK